MYQYQQPRPLPPKKGSGCLAVLGWGLLILLVLFVAGLGGTIWFVERLNDDAARSAPSATPDRTPAAATKTVAGAKAPSAHR